MDLLEIQAEWGRMEDDKKSYFQECYQKEKVEMGSNYRLNYKSKRKNDTNEDELGRKVTHTSWELKLKMTFWTRSVLQ